MAAPLEPEALGVVGCGEDSLGEGAAAVGRPVVLVEAGVAAAHVVAEAGGRDMHVEEGRRRVARVAKGVHDVRRRGSEGSRPRGHCLELRPERQLDLALEHVERVGVVVVDVRVGAVLAGLVAEPAHDQLLELAQDADRPLGAVGHDLAFAGQD